MEEKIQAVLSTGPLCFWDFGEPDGVHTARGKMRYSLTGGDGNPPVAGGGLFSSLCAEMGRGRYFTIPRGECLTLNFSGTRSRFSIAAWIRRRVKAEPECQAIAGMWNETTAQRQYCLFLDLRIHDSRDQVCGHISATGGPTEGYPYCMDASIGATPVPYDKWCCIACTYDGSTAVSYLNGRLDASEGKNPYYYGRPLFPPAAGGADFTVGAVDRGGEMGNWFEGHLGGLAVYDRTLTPDSLGWLSRNTLAI